MSVFTAIYMCRSMNTYVSQSLDGLGCSGGSSGCFVPREVSSLSSQTPSERIITGISAFAFQVDKNKIMSAAVRYLD